MVEARQHQNRSERGSRFILGSQRSHCHDKTSSGVVDSSEGVGWKGRMSSTTDMYRSRILKGAEIGRLGGYGFRGTVTVGDGSNQKGGNGSGYANLPEGKKGQQRKVRCEEEGSSSNRPELAAFVLALHGIPLNKLMLYLCDNQALLKAMKR